MNRHPATAQRPWLLDGPPKAPRSEASRSEAPQSGATQFEAARSSCGPRPDVPAVPAAVLFDRDGTLVVDVPYNGDPGRVRLMPTARSAVEAVRAAGIPVGVVSNQSGIARGLLTREQVEAVRRRVDELLGPFSVWAICPHGPGEGCGCRKPEPGLVLAACERLGVPARRTTVIGDIGADVAAARAAGARGVLVPTPVTRAEEIEAADTVAPDLLSAVRLVLSPPGAPAATASARTDRTTERGATQRGATV
ncbi:D-glycero-alpha-D-manno-heptose-1,7-bisphosphate 7-phosphatase [Streptomyces sp. NPDC087844]|uniref:D-glycero-alpha-D-manno-heptose-1,7-bisphosphate 7-phosphatase n=1 Tax=Streptomyces sp. NPDC087844 TaxID=3365805 RepID=UPI00381F789F